MTALGQSLREAREARNISIEEIAAATKIVPRYLEALEDDRLDVMPGGFFIKGIIRTYAKAVGLDPEEVLARYKAAGLIGEPERKRHVFPKAAAEPAPPLPPPLAPASVLEPEPPAAVDDAGRAPELLIEPAPRPKLSPAARKRILAWSLRTVAVLIVVGVLAALWTARRPRPPEGKPGALASGPALTRDTLPPPRDTAVTTAPSAAPGPKLEPAPAAEEVWNGVTIEITFHAETWITVRTDGEIKIDGLFPAGTSARARADETLLINTGNPGGFSFLLNGQRAKPLGRSGQLLTDIKITPGNYKSFLAQLP
jgi:transcriptional regulator with XRE-family HTH domain